MNPTPRRQPAQLAPEVFRAPTEDARFCGLPEDVRSLVCDRLRAMQTIAAARTVRVGLLAVTRDERGWTKGSLNKLWYAFLLRSGDWTVLVDRARAGPAWWKNLKQEGIPIAFAEFLGQQACANQRGKFRSYFLHTLVPQYRRWANGDAAAEIPGYLTCPPPNGDGLPHGWSEGNLRRVADRVASDYSRTLIQIGPKAASQLSVPILTTREGIAVGQVYIFDDSKNDFKVLFRARACDLWSLHALDLASGCNVLRGYKPSLNEEGIKVHIREREMIYLLAALGSTIGFHPKGAYLVVEKGTATIRPRDEEVLHSIWPGFFTVQRGPMGGGPGISALFTGPEGGNPRWKAPLESWHNIIRNASASMIDFPGQSGSLARVNDPEGLERLMGLDETLCRCQQALPPELAQRMQFSLMSAFDAVRKLDLLTEVINTRRDHVLEGWRRCGHYIPAFRMAEHLPSMPASLIPTLAPELQEHIRIILAANPNLTTEVALSPREVFQAGAGRLRKFSPGAVFMLLGEVDPDERTVRNALIEMNVPEVDPDEPLRYGPLVRDLNGTEVSLRNGDTYAVRVNPITPEVAWLADAKGRFKGLVQAWGRVNRLDTEALQRRFAVDQKALAQWTAEAKRMAAPITSQASKKAADNAALVTGKTGGQKARAAALRAMEAGVEDFLDGCPQGGAPSGAGEFPAPGEDEFSAEGLL